MNKIITNFQEMGLGREEAQELYQQVEGHIADPVLIEIVDLVQRDGDPNCYHELLHCAHFPKDIAAILEAAKKDPKAAELFGVEHITEESVKAMHLAGFTHDLALMLTKAAIDSYNLEDRIGDPRYRFVKEHHGRSRAILGRLLKNAVGQHVSQECYDETLEILDLSNIRLPNVGVEELTKSGHLYQTVPMIVDGVAYTKENNVRAVTEFPMLVEDSVTNYLRGIITAEEAAQQIEAHIEERMSFAQRITQPNLKFDHKAMSKRLTKKKNFPYLDETMEKHPLVYEAIVASAESDVMELQLQSTWANNAIKGTREMIQQYLQNRRVQDAPGLCAVLEKLDTALLPYQELCEKVRSDKK